jgi:6-phosphofructokinase 2
VPEILTITLNPAVDVAASVAEVVPDRKLYTSEPRVDPGGGGVNVARTIHKLGGEATALVAVGGVMGSRLIDLLHAEGVTTLPVPVSGETRQSFAVTSESTGAQYRFSLPGETLVKADAERLLTAIKKAAPVDGYIVLSGGVAPGLGDDFPQQIQTAIAPHTERLVVDTSKSPLTRILSRPTAPVYLLRVDQAEAAQAAQHAMDAIADSMTFASQLVARGVARMVVAGRGAEGSVLVTQDARYLCRSVEVPVRSKIGAGDAFVGAMTLALARGETPEQALRWGVAAASATVGTDATQLCDRATTEELFKGCVVTPL